MQQRHNETFWRVFSGHLSHHFETYNRKQLIQILDILDETNGNAIFNKFVEKFLSVEQPKVEKDVLEIVNLTRVLQKYKAFDFNPKFQEAMLNYIRMFANEKLDFSSDKLESTTSLVLKMCDIKDE